MSPPVNRKNSNLYILIFIILLCTACGLLLAIVAYSLKGPQEAAKTFDQSKQMLIAAKVLNHQGEFTLIQEDGSLLLAYLDKQEGILKAVQDKKVAPATKEEIQQLAAWRIRPLLTDSEGNISTLKAHNLSLADYLSSNKGGGYATLPHKLFYAILSNDATVKNLSEEEVAKEMEKVSIIVIPVSGFGLWAPIYGYLAIQRKDADSVIGTSWYEHGETPGLGANITEAWWQKQFYGKLIFQEGSDGKTDFSTGEMGIIVVKGKVKDVFGASPKSKSAVDGMSGATLTGDGVTKAYRDSLSPYRNFFIQLRKEEGNGTQATST